MVAKLNRARAENPALQELSNITFLETENDALIAYAKRSPAGTILTVVNVDPLGAQEGLCVVPATLGLPPVFTMHDLLSDVRFQWRLGRNYVRLEPGVRQAHVGPGRALMSFQSTEEFAAIQFRGALPGAEGAAARRRAPRRAGAGRGTDAPVVRGRSAVVQAGDLLRDPHPRLLRRQRRRSRVTSGA